MNVALPPPKPLMIWDGDCHFCRLWIERWREMTDGQVDYASYQEAADRFPEIPREKFQRSVVFVDSDGKVSFAAEAVYRSLSYRPSRKWLSWCYDHVPGFAAISEIGYGMVARNRSFASAMTRLFWGKDVRPPKYFWARKWFLSTLGLVYFIAFVSLWVQIDGLIGENGIQPITLFLAAVRDQIGWHAFSALPTLCWLNSSNTFLHLLCGGGVLLSLLLIFRIVPVISTIALFVFYLSLAIAGQTFFSFQWDILLLEAGFLSIFLAPWNRNAGVSKTGMFLLKFLLFKLMVMSGVVKLTSGDDSWLNLTALDYHYWSQPLPTVFAWWADQHSEWFKHFSVAFCLVVEIIIPIFIWAPRRLRFIACVLLISLQIVIAITGNYCFFNLLTIALCLLLIDDAAVGRKLEAAAPRVAWPGWFGVAAVVLMLPLNAWLIFSAFKPEAELPRPLAFIYGHVEVFRIANGYGLFRVMTTDRKEIVIEGSADGIDWKPYEFKWKPGDVKRAPGWCAPHQPRLDWQMWFAALGSPRERPWFFNLEVRLLEGKEDVTRLFANNPFPENPPRFVRANFYRYRFTTAEERRESGDWWKRQELSQYTPSFSLEDLRRMQ